MKAYIYLFLAIIFEVLGTLLIPASKNFTKMSERNPEAYYKYGGKPTTANIKKGSIPEPKKK